MANHLPPLPDPYAGRPTIEDDQLGRIVCITGLLLSLWAIPMAFVAPYVLDSDRSSLVLPIACMHPVVLILSAFAGLGTLRGALILAILSLLAIVLALVLIRGDRTVVDVVWSYRWVPSATYVQIAVTIAALGYRGWNDRRVFGGP